MFTGIIQEAGQLESLSPGLSSTDLTVKVSSSFDDVILGESIAVNGVCLTVVKKDNTSVTFNVLNETLRVTNLGLLNVGTKVNLERSLRASDRMGGHFVTGHVDGTGLIKEWKREGNDYRLLVECPEEVAELCVKKGSITIDGISLTVADISGCDLLVWIIPHTREVTNMKDYQPGIVVNLESDILGKHISRIMDARQGGKTGCE